jgi:hypothetical protein
MVPSDGIHGNLLCPSAPGRNEAIGIGVLCVASNKCRVDLFMELPSFSGLCHIVVLGKFARDTRDCVLSTALEIGADGGDSTFPLRSGWTDRFPWMSRGGRGMCHLLSATFCEFNKNVLSRIQFPE